jgi:hypothetical protein
VRGTGFLHGYPITATGTQSFTSTSTPRYGNVYTLPAWSSAVEVAGIEGYIRLNTGSGVTGYFTSGSGASATTVATDSGEFLAAEASATATSLLCRLWFSTPQTVNAGDSFRLSLGSSNANSTLINYLDANAAADFGSWNTWGANAVSTSRSGANNWTDLTTRLYGLWPIFTDRSYTAGSGGLVIHPGMSGGMRG